jgi:two-component system OmpR family sensor kinase
MKIDSLYTKIKLIFLVLTLLLTALFAAYFFITMGRQMMQVQQRYMGATKLLHQYYRLNKSIDLEAFLANSHLHMIEDEVLKYNVVTQGERVKRKHMPLPLQRRFQIIRFEGNHYLYIKRKHFKILLKDSQPPQRPIHLIGWYVVALFLVVLFYFWITKSLKPLKELQRQIKQVGEGALSLSLKRKGGDEIADVANEFDNALRKIESLVNSRQLFLRTIMHELKTPIAKGRFVTQMVKERRIQEKYETIFERLELLIEEFSQIEKMFSSNYQLKRHTYSMYNILDQAIELLILEEDVAERIEVESRGAFSLYTDFNLLALALKNLLDNALKYSSDHKVKVVVENHTITIVNRGDPLSGEIESFFKPFHQQTHVIKGGLGLGLYIVHSIVDTLALKLRYRYRYSEGCHVFSIEES